MQQGCLVSQIKVRDAISYPFYTIFHSFFIEIIFLQITKSCKSFFTVNLHNRRISALPVSSKIFDKIIYI